VQSERALSALAIGTTVSGSELRAAIIVNPTKVDSNRLRAMVAEATPADWQETLWFETTREDLGDSAAREAIAAGATVIIVAGGDGTVRAVAQAVAGSDAALALLPSGTGNLLARNLKMALNDPAAALDIAFAGDSRPVDIARIETEASDGSRKAYAYMVMAGIGLDADMASGTNESVKRTAGWIAYAPPIAKSVITRKHVRVRHRLDQERSGRSTAHTIIVGNCGTLTGNLLLLPEAVIDDGLLDVVILSPIHAWGWIQVGVRLLLNRVLHRTRAGRAVVRYGRQVPGLEYSQGHTFTARFDQPEPLELDGDDVGQVIAFRSWIDHNAVTLKEAKRNEDVGISGPTRRS
jgi:diacylglycerol kinase family enzyme